MTIRTISIGGGLGVGGGGLRMPTTLLVCSSTCSCHGQKDCVVYSPLASMVGARGGGVTKTCEGG